MGLSYCNISIIGLFSILSSCTIMPVESQRPCDKGHTRLNGTCVAQNIVNYVSCIEGRASGFSSEKNRMLAAEVGTMGVQASGATDLSERLHKSFDSSDKVAMTILKHCHEKTSVKKQATLLPSMTPVGLCLDYDQQKTSKFIKCSVKKDAYPLI